MIIRNAKVAGREHAALIPIVFKGTWLTNQPINHVPVIDPMFAVSMEPRHSIDLFLGIPDLKMFSSYGLKGMENPFPHFGFMHSEMILGVQGKEGFNGIISNEPEENGQEQSDGAFLRYFTNLAFSTELE